MNRKFPLSLLIILFGLILIAYRIYAVKSGTGLSFVFYPILILGMFFLVVSIIQALNKKIKPLILLLFFLIISILAPFEYFLALISFKLDNRLKKTVVTTLQVGGYDSLILHSKFPDEGIQIEKNVTVYKYDSLELAFFRESFWWSREQYSGILFISDPSRLRDKRVFNFLHREFESVRLYKNWYWVKCFIDLEGGP